MLVHICCSVDNFYYLYSLQKKYPHEKFIGFFYNPNIHPYDEYRLRLLDTQRSCNILGIPLIEGEYDDNTWFHTISGLENEPEKGKRCSSCFDLRLKKIFLKAQELNETSVTTTLFMSPLKNLEQIANEAQYYTQQTGITFVIEDFRLNGGQQRMREMARDQKAYHQDYCGCSPALFKQRQSQNRPLYEFYSSLTQQPSLDTAHERLLLYQLRLHYEQHEIPYTITKVTHTLWRLESGVVKNSNISIPSYILYYSLLSQPLKGKPHLINHEFATFKEAFIITINYLNKLLNRSIQHVQELMFQPLLTIEDEILLRNLLTHTPYSTNPIIIVDSLPLFISIDFHALLFSHKKDHLINLS